MLLFGCEGAVLLVGENLLCRPDIYKDSIRFSAYSSKKHRSARKKIRVKADRANKQVKDSYLTQALWRKVQKSDLN